MIRSTHVYMYSHRGMKLDYTHTNYLMFLADIQVMHRDDSRLLLKVSRSYVLLTEKMRFHAHTDREIGSAILFTDQVQANRVSVVAVPFWCNTGLGFRALDHVRVSWPLGTNLALLKKTLVSGLQDRLNGTLMFRRAYHDGLASMVASTHCGSIGLRAARQIAIIVMF